MQSMLMAGGQPHHFAGLPRLGMSQYTANTASRNHNDPGTVTEKYMIPLSEVLLY